MKVVTVFDSAAQAYSNPVFAVSQGVAMRSFMDAAGAKDTTIGQHPEHHSLFLLGSFEPTTAEFDLLPAPQLLMNAWELNKQ